MSSARDRWVAARRRDRRGRRLEEYRAGLRPLAVAAWDITKDHNVGSLIRTAHAVAAEEVILVGEREWNVEAAMTAELYTTITFVDTVAAFLDHLTERRFNLVAVELDPRAEPLFTASYPERPCFLLGAGRGGVPVALMAAARSGVEIPQWGLVPSLNVAVAGSIVLYDYLAKLHRRGELDRPAGGLAPTAP